jgi:hypothetical protein
MANPETFRMADRVGFLNRSWRFPRPSTPGDPEAVGDQVEDYSTPPIARAKTDPRPWNGTVIQQETSQVPECKQASNSTMVELSRRYQKLLEEQQQARQEIARLRTELAGEDRKQGLLYVQRRASLFAGGSGLPPLPT